MQGSHGSSGIFYIKARAASAYLNCINRLRFLTLRNGICCFAPERCGARDA